MRYFKYISIKSIIAKVYEDLNTQLELRTGAIITWIGEGLEHINATLQYEEYRDIIQVKNHKAKLPCDFYSLKAISINGINMTRDLSIPSGHYANLYIENNFTDYNARNNLTFHIIEDEIITGIKNGNGFIYYYRIITDEDGYPMIPDIIEYKEALFNYVVYKAKYASFIAGKIPGNIFEYIKQQWLASKQSALMAINMPDVSTVVSIGKAFNRMVPAISDNYNLNRYSATQEYSG